MVWRSLIGGYLGRLFVVVLAVNVPGFRLRSSPSDQSSISTLSHKLARRYFQWEFTFALLAMSLPPWDSQGFNTKRELDICREKQKHTCTCKEDIHGVAAALGSVLELRREEAYRAQQNQHLKIIIARLSQDEKPEQHEKPEGLSQQPCVSLCHLLAREKETIVN